MSNHVKGMTSCRPPEKSNESEIKPNESEMDLINRWDVLDAINASYGFASAINNIKALPSAQPYTEAELQKMQDLYQAEIDKAFELGQEDARSEIIHCGECKYYHDSDGCFFSTATTRADGFCHWAERKEGEGDADALRNVSRGTVGVSDGNSNRKVRGENTR